jgi:hydroxymethylglutaryl-CoA lyase
MESVEVVEVSLRDGLQNESWILPAAKRVALATELAATGLKRIEAGSFVNSRWVPQMADSDLVLTELRNKQKSGYIPTDVRFSALVPNQQGMDDALKCGAQEIAIFAAASETFSKKNTNCTIDEGFARFAPVVDQAL